MNEGLYKNIIGKLGQKLTVAQIDCAEWQARYEQAMQENAELKAQLETDKETNDDMENQV